MAMNSETRRNKCESCLCKGVALIGVCFIALIGPFNIFSESLNPAFQAIVFSDFQPVDSPDSLLVLSSDTIPVPSAGASVDLPVLTSLNSSDMSRSEQHVFMPDPKRAVWLSALFPGLGQLYNRRFWKLPLVVAGFMGLGYGTSWNNSMLRDYTRAYSDLMDSDPSTKSYMDFFPSTIKESDLDPEWLRNTMKSRKDFYRRNRDLCIISMVGVYLLAMVDAYVDASLSQFDITPDITMHVSPAIIPDTRYKLPGVGLQWALTF